MANQYTKAAGGRWWGGRGPSKFSVTLSADEADQLDQLAGLLNRDKSNLIRQLVPALLERAKRLHEAFPDVPLSVVPAADLLSPDFEKWMTNQQVLWAASKVADSRRQEAGGNAFGT